MVLGGQKKEVVIRLDHEAGINIGWVGMAIPRLLNSTNKRMEGGKHFPLRNGTVRNGSSKVNV